MARVSCKQCGELITELTFQKNDGLCMLCKKGARTCTQCGKRTFGVTRGLPTGKLCLACLGAHERKKSTQIEAFIQAQGQGDCTLLRALYQLDERLRLQDADAYIGLNLIDPPRPYRECATALYDPRRTPKHAIALAATGGDDVHFSLVGQGTYVGDESPVVMTVPMAGDDVRVSNVILGANLHEFLCLGCEHGFSELEQLLYDRAATIAKLSSPVSLSPVAQLVFGEGAAKTLRAYRETLGLRPWTAIATRLQELEAQFQGTLQFES